MRLIKGSLLAGALMLAWACADPVTAQVITKLPGSNTPVVPTAIVDASGNQVTTFGGAGTLGQTTKALSQPVTLPSDPDFSPTSGNITAADAATGTVAGQSSVTLVTGTPTASSFQTWSLNGHSSASLTVTGTFSATAKIETSADGGVTYAPATGKILGSALTTSSITAPGVFRVDVTGMDHIRVRASAYTSGALAVKLTASASPGLTQVDNPLRLTDSTGAEILGNTACAAWASGNGDLCQFLKAIATAAISTSAQPTKAQDSAGNDATDTTLHASNVKVVNTVAIPTNPQAAASGGGSSFHLITANSNNASLVSTGAHTLLWIIAQNPSTTAGGCLHIYDATTSPPVPGTTAIRHTFPISVAAAANQQGGFALPLGAFGDALATGFGVSVTGGSSGACPDSDTSSAPGSISVEIGYK